MKNVREKVRTFFNNIKALPIKAKGLLVLGGVFALVVALPLFVWAIVNVNFNPFKKAASGEPIRTSTPVIPSLVSTPISESPRSTSKSGNLCPAMEACPVLGYANLLRNCHPPEADNSPQESLCGPSFVGRVEFCGTTNYCCNGTSWTIKMSACLTPTPSAIATPIVYPPPPTPRVTSTPGICINTCGNGVCEEVTCSGSGCSCPESAFSCPADCSTKTPTPTPKVVNNKPVISSYYIPPAAFVGRSYRASVRASDRDVNDNLVAWFSNLPPGLTYSCSTSKLPITTNISCQIYGVPSTAGFYRISFNVTDLKGYVATTRYYNTAVINIQRFPWYR